MVEPISGSDLDAAEADARRRLSDGRECVVEPTHEILAIIARLRRSEAALATARRDALEEAAQTMAALPITAVKWDDSYEEGEWGKIDLFDHAIKETIAVASSAIRAMIEEE